MHTALLDTTVHGGTGSAHDQLLRCRWSLMDQPTSELGVGSEPVSGLEATASAAVTQDAARRDRRRTDRKPVTVRSEHPTTRDRDRRATESRAPRSLWANAAALGLLLFTVLALAHPQAVVVPDEGLYLAQADALADGSWSVEREALDVDADGELSRLLPEATLGDREVPYARHSLYPLMLTPAFLLGGYLGTLALSVLGLWGTALSGALIAQRLDRRFAIPTLWLIGAGSPLLFYGFVTMAHSLAAAAGGFAFLGLTRWLDDRRWTGLASGVPALLATVLLRSEGTIYALGVAAAIGLLALVGPGSPRRLRGRTIGRARRVDLRGLMTAVLTGVAVVVTYLIDTRLDHAVTGNAGYGVNPAAIATRSSADPVSGSWASLLRPFAGSWGSGALWVTLASTLVIAASAGLVSAPGRRRLAIALLAGAGVSALCMLADPPGLVTGMLVAFPLLPAGLIWLRRCDLSGSRSGPLTHRIVLVSLITTAGLVATLYSNGGAAEWGGRFFQILIPVLTPLAVLGLDRAAAVFSAPQRAMATACVVLVTAALSISALRAQGTIREEAADTVEGTIEHLETAFPGERTLVIVATMEPSGNSRLFWAEQDSAEMITTIGIERLDHALDAAHDAGITRAVVVSDATPDEFAEMVGDELGSIGWEVLDGTSTPKESSELYFIGER